MKQLTVVFGGTPAFAVPALEALLAAGHRVAAVYTQPDRPAGRGRHLAPSAVKEVALRHGLTVEQPKSLRDPEAATRLVDYRPDVMIVVAYGLLLPPAILQVPKLGCVNIHGSLLPRWRGAAPIQRAIEAGDTTTGVSIMCMDEGLDTGPVLSMHEIRVDARETAATLHDRLATLGAQALVDTLDKYASGDVQPRPQSTMGVTYAHKLRKEEAPLDWTRSAAQLDAQIRAFNPWPVAETRWRGRQLRVWDSAPIGKEASIEAAPGTVLRADSSGIVVATGAGSLSLVTVQLPGGKPLSSRQFLSAHRVEGDILGGDADLRPS